jgi:ornithine carbamoyltransferase
MKHLLSISNLSTEELARLVDMGMELVTREWKSDKPLKDKMIGIFFRRPSTRTRTSFSVGALRLGASIVTYGPNDLQLVTGESAMDTARVLAEYLDALVIRTNDSIQELEEIAQQQKMPIINAMTENEHPTQAIGDLITLCEAFGQLKGLHILYLGEGNNTAAALALAVAKTPGMRLTLVTPEKYGLRQDILEEAVASSAGNESIIEQHHQIDLLPRNVDAVYTTRWETMGVKHVDPNWRAKFEPYRVTSSLMAQVSKPSGTIFMHDLPAVRGSDVVDEVLDGPQSWAFRQARHKLTSAMAVLTWALADA